MSLTLCRRDHLRVLLSRIFLDVWKDSFTQKPEAKTPKDSVLDATGSDILQRRRETIQTRPRRFRRVGRINIKT